jgi:CheY-like chemotaxis protein
MGYDRGVLTRVPSALVVDDDAGVRGVLAELLDLRGCRAVTARDACAALALAGAEMFDIFFVDFNMPGIDGVSLASELRTRGHTAPIVLVTADAHAVDDARRTAAGIQRVVAKPFRYDQILECLDLVMSPAGSHPKGVRQ